jgi:hypothetical protein
MAITRLGGANAITGTIPNSVLAAGNVIQVVSTTKLDVFTTTSTSFTDITGLSVAITPTSSSSKIYITATGSISIDGSDRNGLLKLVRGSTDIFLADQSGSNRVRASGGIHTTHGVSQYTETYNVNVIFLDTPNTTNATTYKLQGLTQSSSQTFTWGRTSGSADDTNRASFPSSITVMEIAG